MLTHNTAAIIGFTIICIIIIHHRFVQEGLLVVGKDLSAIATMLGFKTRADVVEFYYNWKNQNESYKQWVEHRKLVCVHTLAD
jgi:hypothetical protein